MAKVRFNMAAESSTTTGTGNVTVGGAKNPGQTLTASGVAVSDTFKYRMSHDTLNEWEIGTATMLTSTTFSRSVINSSNANALVNFSAGNKTVELVLDAADIAERASTTEVLTGTDVVKPVTADALAALWEKGTDNAGGATITLGDGHAFDLITSTTTITAFAYTTDKVGRRALIRFATARQVTHNATTLISPTSDNLQMAAGDMMEVISLGSGNFRILEIMRSDVPLGVVAVLIANAAATNATTNLSASTFTIPAATPRIRSKYRFRLHYVFLRTAAPPTLTCEVLINGSVVESIIITHSASATTVGGWVEAQMTFRTIGAGGTVMVTMTQATNGGTNIANQIIATTGTATDAIDTTVARSIEMRIRMTTAVASNTLTVVDGDIEKVN